MSKKSRNNKLKGPLFVTVALISCYPVWIAQEALATPSGVLPNASAASSIGLQQHLAGSRSPLGLQIQHQSKTTPSLVQTRFPYYSPQDLIDARAELAKAESIYNNIKIRLTNLLSQINTLTEKVSEAQHLYDIATSNLETASANLASAISQQESASRELVRITSLYENALAAKNSADESLTQQLQIKEEAQQTFDEALAAKQIALTMLNAKESALAAALLTKNQKYDTLQQTQSDYNNSAIPDPSWVHPTYQQEHTRQVEITTTRTTGGLTATTYNRQGYNNAPPMPSDNETPISTQTVPNVDYNWGSGQVLNSNRSEDVIVKFTGYLQVPTTDYYHFYTPADDGTRLYINNQFLIDDWYDKGGGGSTSQAVYLTAGQVVPITLYYYENGGGAAVSFQYYTYSAPYYQVVPAAWLGSQTQTITEYVTETYYTTELVPGATAPLIKDASLLPAITSAQREYDDALAEYNNASAAKSAAQTSYEATLPTLTSAESDLASATSNVSSAEELKSSTTTSYEELAASKASAESDLQSANTLVATSQEVEATTKADHVARTSQLEATNKQLTSVKEQATTTQEEATKQSTKVATLKEQVAVIEATPEPEGAKEIPADLSADNLMEVDLASVDPTELTEAQAEQLKEAALETFLTAEEGSPEYEQALDALYLAAEQDDIVLSPELAAIPGLAAATELINFLGNAGSDMSPKTREESEKVVVAAVVAAGAAIQSAAAAASTASGTTRRIGN